MAQQPLFSVIVTDFEPSIDRGDFRRKMACLAAQTCKDFEVLVYHDGPKPTPYAQETAGIDLHPQTRFIVTEARANDWGHTNRDRGIREAQGTWIIHTNADNVFYPTLIERLKAAIEDPEPPLREVDGSRPRLRIARSIQKRWHRLTGTKPGPRSFEPLPRKADPDLCRAHARPCGRGRGLYTHPGAGPKQGAGVRRHTCARW